MNTCLSVKVTILTRLVDFVISWPVDRYIEGLASHIEICVRLDINDKSRAAKQEAKVLEIL